MKCPKCNYIGFEATDRCRNCGYEFALTAEVTEPPDLPIGSGDEGGPLADLAIRVDATQASGPGRRAPDLDRLVGVPDSTPSTPVSATPSDLPLFGGASGSATRTPAGQARHRLPPAGALRTEATRPPIAVGRTPSEPLRPRPRSREDMRVRTATLDLPLPPATTAQEAPPAGDAGPAPVEPAGLVLAPPALRLAAAAIDVALVGAIDLATVYFTVRLVGLGLSEWHALPLLPLGAFFLILNGGYLAVFTAAGGQSLGKMVAGVKVVSADVGPVPLGAASLRALGAMASTLCLGVGLWPAFADEERRALYDRLAETRVVRTD